jgi:predicted alpha-1,2-mannosidase
MKKLFSIICNLLLMFVSSSSLIRSAAKEPEDYDYVVLSKGFSDPEEQAEIKKSLSLIEYVDPLIGTGIAKTVSALRPSEAGSEEKGQNFPAVGRPFGMTQWTPETRTTEIKCISPYYYNDNRITGFRGSHWMSGSCTQDYGSVTLMPFTASRPDTVRISPVSAFSHKNEKSTPAYYSVFLDDFGIQAELAGSVRSGMLRLTFPGDKVNCIFIRPNSDENHGKTWVNKQNNEINGYNPVHRIYQGRGQSAGFSGYFVIRFDKPFRLIPQDNNQQNMIVSFGNQRNLIVRIGTSFTSIDAARNNLNAEIPDWNFDRLCKDTEEIWNRTLGKIQVEGGTDDDLIKFYTALYHCYQLPRIASDADGSYQGFAQDTLIHKASGFDYYDDFSMWDTYRALHPLMTILEPEKTLDMVKSLVLKAKQGGWMPIFPVWGSYTAAMIGDHVSTMICDAYIKGIRNFDSETAYRYMRQNAFDSPSREEYVDGKGRRALTSYIQYGYIPLEDSVWDAFHKREQVSRTLEYAFDDYALAMFAKSLGKTDDYRILLNRSKNYRNVFDISTGYVRGRHSDKTWVEPFDPYKKAYYICEGTPFQYTWYAPHDVPGLISLMGGKKAFLKRLNEFFDGGYYWHGNETDQQAPFMFTMANNPSKTEEWTHRIISEEYGTGPGGLSGNEDAGQMSAWLVFAMMGFYPVCPGTDQYVMTAPSFDRVRIQLADRKYFTIASINRNIDNYYIQSVTRNGVKFAERYLKHEDIINGSSFVFQVTNKLPN